MNRVKLYIKGIFIFLVLFLTLGFTRMPESSPNQSLLSQIAPLKIASGTFVQRKYFKVLKHPITSQGELYFEQGLGLLWQTNKPVLSRILLKASGVYTDDGINPIKEIKGASTTAAVLMNAIIGNVQAITQTFDVKPSKKSHCLLLTPIDYSLTKVIDAIELCIDKAHLNKEDNVIENVVIYEESGNRTEIDLTLKVTDTLSEVVRDKLR